MERKESMQDWAERKLAVIQYQQMPQVIVHEIMNPTGIECCLKWVGVVRWLTLYSPVFITH